MPLALVVVAARAAVHPSFALATLAAELRASGGGLSVLRGGDAVADVRVVFSWSCRRLGAPAARLFRLLGLHPGPDIGAGAAASLAGVARAEARQALTELVRASLLDEHRPNRYAFHDLLRAYAAELASTVDPAAERDAATDRLLDHYLQTGHTAAILLNPHDRPPRAAPVRPGVVPDRLTGEPEARAWFDAEHRVLTTAGRAGDLPGQAVTYRQLARAHIRLHRFDEAGRALRPALELYERLGDHSGQALVHGNLSYVADQQSRPRDAIGPGRRALELFRAAGDLRGQGIAHNNLGWFHLRLDDWEQALDHCEQALALQREMGDRTSMATTLDSIGYARHRLGQYGSAADHYRQALRLFREAGERCYEADTLVHLGDNQQAAGEADAARDTWRQALTILDELGHPDAAKVRDRLA